MTPATSRTAQNAEISSRGRGNSLQVARSDNAKRAFAADEQMLQVVAGIVFAQPLQGHSRCARPAEQLQAPGPDRGHCHSAAC